MRHLIRIGYKNLSLFRLKHILIIIWEPAINNYNCESFDSCAEQSLKAF